MSTELKVFLYSALALMVGVLEFAIGIWAFNQPRTLLPVLDYLIILSVFATGTFLILEACAISIGAFITNLIYGIINSLIRVFAY